jgi:hypothetical protein
MHILDESYMAEYERINFIHFFENTINNQENIPGKSSNDPERILIECVIISRQKIIF